MWFRYSCFRNCFAGQLRILFGVCYFITSCKTSLGKKKITITVHLVKVTRIGWKVPEPCYTLIEIEQPRRHTKSLSLRKLEISYSLPPNRVTNGSFVIARKIAFLRPSPPSDEWHTFCMAPKEIREISKSSWAVTGNCELMLVNSWEILLLQYNGSCISCI